MGIGRGRWRRRQTSGSRLDGCGSDSSPSGSSRTGRGRTAGRWATGAGVVALVAGGALAAAGGLASASPELTLTTAPTSPVITLGQSNTDVATLPVTGADSGLTVAGYVQFGWCGPFATTPASGGCATATGTATVTSLGTPQPLDVNTAGTAYTATSPSFTPTVAGVYCFDASGPSIPSALRSHGTSGSGGSSSTNTVTTVVDNECFTVEPGIPTPNPVPPPTPTPSDTITASATPTTLTVGGTVTDSALVTGTGGGTPTGSVSFTVCGPTQGATPCTADATDATGASTTDLGPSAQVAHSTGTSTAAATSAPFRPSTPGTYCFDATYSGNAAYAPASDNATATQCVVAVAAATAVTTTPPSSPPATKAGGSTSPVTKAGGSTSSATPVVAQPATRVTGAASTPVPIAGATTVHTGMWWAGSTAWVAATAGGGVVLIGLGQLLRRRRTTARAH